ncbi:hypothetical protein [Polymorphospora rubra]|uniref:hypothetical protein n=1 Tax=Polymorphospora rubra TaxID=338584 RepID=UPI0033CF2BA2
MSPAPSGAGSPEPVEGETPTRQSPGLEADLDDGAAASLSVGDPVLRKTRLLSRQCDTCIFRPGNLMHLSDGRLRELVSKARDDESFIICHDTLPYHRHPDVKPAICRGFADQYSTQGLRLLERLFGFVEVAPPPTTSDHS